jgi:hypothetical protein
MRGLEEAGLGLPGIRERPALEAEQLGLQQGLRDGGAVDVHEGAPRAWTRLVKDVGDQPLARAGRPLDQHRRDPPAALRPGEQPADLGPDGLDGRALPEHLLQRVHGVP